LSTLLFDSDLVECRAGDPCVEAFPAFISKDAYGKKCRLVLDTNAASYSDYARDFPDGPPVKSNTEYKDYLGRANSALERMQHTGEMVSVSVNSHAVVVANDQDWYGVGVRIVHGLCGTSSDPFMNARDCSGRVIWVDGAVLHSYVK